MGIGLKRVFLSLGLVMALAGLVFLIEGNVHAARGTGQAYSSADCTNDDNRFFPYGFMCGTDPQVNTPIEISTYYYNGLGVPVPFSNDGTVNVPPGGTSIHVQMSWGHASEPFVTGDPKRDGDQPATQSLPFVIFNTTNPSFDNEMSLFNPSPSDGVISQLCPGVQGGSRFGKIWGNRDTNSDYTSSAGVNGDNQSGYAYDGSSQGVVNCQDSGRMAYWKGDSPSRTKTYSFDIDVPNDVNSPSGKNNCIRGYLSMRFGDNNQFGADNLWFPPASDKDVPPNNSGTPGVLTPSQNSRITATHIVKNSSAICFDIVKPAKVRPDTYWTGTLNATCNPADGTGIISGRITKYNNNFTPNNEDDDNVILPRPNTTYNVQIQNPDGTWRTLGGGTTTATSSGDDGSEYSININAAAEFGSGTQRNFRLEHPGGAGWDYVYSSGGGFYRGANLDCVGDPPSVSVTASCVTGISVTVSDPDSTGSIHVITKRDGGTEIDNRYTLGGTFVIPYGSLRDGYDHSFTVDAVDDTSLATGPVNSIPGTVLGCGNFELDPSAGGAFNPNDEKPTSFDATSSVTVTYPGWTHPTKPAVTGSSTNTITRNGVNVGGPYPSDTSFVYRSYTFSAPITTYIAGDTYCSHLTVGPAKGVMERATGTILWVDPASPTATASSGCQPIVNQPYVHILGSDASAGGGFGRPNCTTANGGIKTYTNGNAGTGITPGGSGAQHGALSVDNSEGFSSALLRNLTPTGYTGLTFSNTSNATGGTLPKVNTGGNLGGTNCVSDYFGKMPASLASTPVTTNNISATKTNLAGTFTQVSEYYEPTGGTLTINAGTIADAVNNVIYVKGNVVITGNITYQNAAWSGLDKVPSLYIIAKGGNIYIDPTVRQLDGLFVSQPDSSNVGGAIYTCASGTTGYTVANASLLASCNSQLVVNGSFIAQKVYLSRGFGSLRNSSPGERLNAANKDCGIDSGSTSLGDCAAEIFNFSPEVYLAQPALPPDTGPTTGKYDYVTSLAPVL